jgi:hypothetical protein
MRVIAEAGNLRRDVRVAPRRSAGPVCGQSIILTEFPGKLAGWLNRWQRDGRAIPFVERESGKLRVIDNDGESRFHPGSAGQRTGQ